MSIEGKTERSSKTARNIPRQGGRKITAAWFEDGSGYNIYDELVDSITEFMKPGQSAHVPWLMVHMADGRIIELNAATLSEIHFEAPSEGAGDVEVDDLIADGEPKI